MIEVPKKKRLSFELDEEMMAMISEEFSSEGIAKRFGQAVAGKEPEEIAEIGRKVFQDYGKNLMQRSLQLGEEYPDRTYELLREAADQTGSLTFPLVPQRFIEIAFLAVQNFVELPVLENNAKRFIFRVEHCRVYERIAGICGDKVAEQLFCWYGCLEACRTAFNGFGIDIDDAGGSPSVLCLPLLSGRERSEYCGKTICCLYRSHHADCRQLQPSRGHVRS